MAEKGPPRRRDPIALIRWVARTDDPTVSFVRDLLVSAFAVVLVGGILFGISGVWPPMVAVESGSMEPHLQRGDLVFVMDESRFVPAEAVGETGVVAVRDAGETDYRRFGARGDVIVFRADGAQRTPIIHRAHFWVNESENWYPKASAEYVLPGGCSAVPNCPAPHAGFITKGDANPLYDQVSGISGPVKPAWVRGTAEARLPLLGYVRLYFTELSRGGLSLTVVE